MILEKEKGERLQGWEDIIERERGGREEGKGDGEYGSL